MLTSVFFGFAAAPILGTERNRFFREGSSESSSPTPTQRKKSTFSFEAFLLLRLMMLLLRLISTNICDERVSKISFTHFFWAIFCGMLFGLTLVDDPSQLPLLPRRLSERLVRKLFSAENELFFLLAGAFSDHLP